ncbi:SDR family NAD(P)-dependent oxidoreductase [Paenibacillus sp. FSL R7-0331]|uniref:SDR family NAD(P)-dependent oxidoreductase n=1 Tax=Paenibacillus sp. FSL R7-0331 TaxID=1536773 RepID=UPI0004F8C685|nr:SDR family oxidoreductase [Paenibacillus sp. FSL R7-0331]AIQ53105.1 oxidoreductase [Paenibacillus sp. FSL R7-0331]
MIAITNKWTLITGASSGIGEAFAHEFAARGSHLILVARSETKLINLAERLHKKHGIQAQVMVSDLSHNGSAAELYQQCVQRGLNVDCLINNAGFATHGLFEQLSGPRQHDEVMLNVAAVVDLTHLFLPDMLNKKSGMVINVASTAAFQPTPSMAVYGATKAFVLSFTEALWEENRKRGVQFLALCPGSTETEFFNIVGTDEASVGKRDTPENVVQVALRALQAKKVYAIPGIKNFISAQMPRFFTKKQILFVVGRMLRTRH